MTTTAEESNLLYYLIHNLRGKDGVMPFPSVNEIRTQFSEFSIPEPPSITPPAYVERKKWSDRKTEKGKRAKRRKRKRKAIRKENRKTNIEGIREKEKDKEEEAG